jgi:hypothetical protein
MSAAISSQSGITAPQPRSGVGTKTSSDRVIRLALLIGLAMALTVVGTVFGGRSVAFISILPLVITIVIFSARDSGMAISLLFVYLAMEGMYKYLSGFSQVIYVIRPLLSLVILGVWLLSLKIRKAKVTAGSLGILIALFFGWGLVEVLNPFGRGPVSGLATLLLFYVSPVIFYLIGVNVIKSTSQVETFCYVFLAACTIVSAFALVQFIMGQGWTEAHLPGYKDITQTNWFVQNNTGRVTASSFRPASTTDIGGGASSWACFGMVTAVCLFFSPRLSSTQKLGLILCAAINMGGLLVEGVRLWLITGIFAVFIFLLVIPRSLHDMIRKMGLLLLVLVVAFGAFQVAQAISGGILSQRYAATAADPLAKFQHDRGYNLTDFVHLATDYPLGLGYVYGLGRQDTNRADLDPAQAERNGETQFGSITGDMGIPGLVLLYALMTSCLVIGWKALRSLRDGHLRTIAAMLLASLACFFPASFAGPVMQGQIQFWFMAAVLAALPAIEKRERIRQATLSTRAEVGAV